MKASGGSIRGTQLVADVPELRLGEYWLILR